MAYSLISHRGDTLGGTGGTTAAFNSSRADLIIVAIGYAQVGAGPIDATMVSDNKGNTYTALSNSTTPNHYATRMFYCQAPIVGPGHTVTFDNGATSSGASICVACFRGSSTSPLDVQSTFAADAGVSTLDVTPFTTTEDSELIVCAFIASANGTLTINNGFTILDRIDAVDGVSVACTLAYRFQAVSGQVNPTWGNFFGYAASSMAALKDNAPAVTRTTTWEQAGLELLFNGTTFDNVAKNATSSPLTNLELSLHTADPAEDGNQTTHEVTYTSYARTPVARDTNGWTVVDDVAQPVSTIIWPSGTGGSGTATFFGVGTDHTGAGRLLYSGPIDPPIVCGSGVTPALGVDSRIGAPIVPSTPVGTGIAVGVASASADAKNDIGHGTAAGLASLNAPSNNRIGIGGAAGTTIVNGHSPGDLTLLNLDDIRYLGYYDFQPDATNTSYISRLSHRYVDGHFRLLTLATGGTTLHELSIEGMSFGDLRFTTTNDWDMSAALISTQATLGYNGIWWDAVNNRLLWCCHVDYSNQAIPAILRSIVLNETSHTTDSVHTVRLEAGDAKEVYGGFDRNPAWFRSAYSVPEYICGWGGYSSLVGVGASMGPFFCGLPEILNYSQDATIPATDTVVMADHHSGTTSVDWYLDTTQTFDRGVRLTFPVNYFDGGDPRSNPTTRPVSPPISTAGWLSPAPDGLGRWIFGDSHFGSGCWIDTGSKAAFVTAFAGTADCGYYANSVIQNDGRIAELHIYDPIHMGEVALGSRAVWNLKPTYIRPLETTGQTSAGSAGEANAVNGMTYDSITKRLYTLSSLYAAHIMRVHVYAIDSGTLPSPASRILYPADGDTVKGVITMYAGINCSIDRFASGIVIYFQSADRSISDSGAEMTYPVPFQRQIDTTLFPNGLYDISASDHHNTTSIRVTVAN